MASGNRVNQLRWGSVAPFNPTPQASWSVRVGEWAQNIFQGLQNSVSKLFKEGPLAALRELARTFSVATGLTPARLELFPPIQPYKTHRLKVSNIHELYIEESGNPNGYPVMFLHGGPGGGTSPKMRQFFDPKFYRIILMDQRGCGKSTPHAELRENTTPNLVKDIESVRKILGIEKWAVFGGSWGSTLSLAYAEAHPDKVTGLILRGIFLCRPSELEWLYQKGAENIYPDAWEDYVKPIPPTERKNMIGAFYKRLTDKDPKVQLEAAKPWGDWEHRTMQLFPSEPDRKAPDYEKDVLAISRIENHYFQNNGFMKPNQLLNIVDKIRHIPTWIVQGRYDIVCPPKSAWDLKKAFPEAQLNMVSDAGHASMEPGIVDGLVRATEAFKKQQSPKK
jgi:proline iminopeptidase